MPAKTAFQQGDYVIAPAPDGDKTQLLQGVIMGKTRRKVAVDFGRNSSDVWVYDVTEIKPFN